MGRKPRILTPVRSPKGIFAKWFVSREQYAEDTYPQYMKGLVYVVSRPAAECIVKCGYKLSLEERQSQSERTY